MSERELIERMTNCILTYDVEGIKTVSQDVIRHRIDPVNAIENGLAKGMRIIGDKFGDGEIFLTELMLAAETMSKALEILKPELKKSKKRLESSGKILIATVHGDMHDIGKNVVASLLNANGFEVIDLGVDVSIDKIIEAVKEKNPDIIGLSSLMTSTLGEQRKVLEALKDEGLRTKVRVIVGGAPVTREWAEKIDADGTAEDASEAVKVALSLMKRA